jgi:hypothetical protein
MCYIFSDFISTVIYPLIPSPFTRFGFKIGEQYLPLLHFVGLFLSLIGYAVSMGNVAKRGWG